MSIIYIQNRFELDELYKDFPEAKKVIGSDGKDKRLERNIFLKVPEVFTDNKINDDDIHIIGIMKNKRTWKYIQKKYIEIDHENLMKYKVILPGANGSGAIGEVLSTPLIGTPLIGYTRSFIGIGSFDTIEEAENCLKYIKCKFTRTALGILKVTQGNPKDTWKYVPLQDFTENSDIDWTQSVHDIDIQLYEKYDLDADEIEFIEDKVKEMD